jgi:hypothetical protein
VGCTQKADTFLQAERQDLYFKGSLSRRIHQFGFFLRFVRDSSKGCGRIFPLAVPVEPLSVSDIPTNVGRAQVSGLVFSFTPAS